MVVVKLRDCGGVGGKLSWNERQKNDYFVLQALKPVLFKNANKNFRILLANTTQLLQNRKAEGAGKLFIIAESDDFEEIAKDWTFLNVNILPVLKSSTFDSQARLQATISSEQEAAGKKTIKPTVTAGTSISTETFTTILEESRPEPEKSSTSSKSSTPATPSTPVPQTPTAPPLEDSEDVIQALEEFSNKIAAVQTNLKLLGTAKETEKVKQGTVSGMKELRTIDTQLKTYFTKNQKSLKTDTLLQKLSKQYDEFKQTKDKLEKDSKIQNLERKAVVDIYEQKDKKRAANGGPTEAGGEQLLVQKQRPKVDQFTMSTVDVEHTIAQETLNELKGIETDMMELNGMMKDFNHIVKEQDPMISMVYENVDKASYNVSKGTQDIKQAKKYMRPLG